MESEQQSQDLTDSKLLNEQQRNILSKFKGPSDVKGAKVQVMLGCKGPSDVKGSKV